MRCRKRSSASSIRAATRARRAPKAARSAVDQRRPDDEVRSDHARRARARQPARRIASSSTRSSATRPGCARSSTTSACAGSRSARARKGRALDRTRLLPLVTRNDPRILVARTPQRRTDLFLGVDRRLLGLDAARATTSAARSGSRRSSPRRCGPLPGVEARFFGFTDSVIYDAGDRARLRRRRPRTPTAATTTRPALYHAANVAMASHKRAKVLVMISDGLPTECSVEALRGLVADADAAPRHRVRAGRGPSARGSVLPELRRCSTARIETAVARFGRMIGDLARRSLLA